MNIYIETGEAIRADLTLRWTLRSDLAPVPRTVEFTVQVADEVDKYLAEGKRIVTGREALEYLIIKSDLDPPDGYIQGKQSIQSRSVIAILASCAEIAFRRSRAVVLEGKQFRDIYASCGAKITMANDIAVPRFTCFKGHIPSFGISAALQEAGACIVYRDGMRMVRLPDLFKQDAMDAIEQTDSTGHIESEFMQRHEIPAFYSLDVAGAIVKGNFTKDRAVSYIPRTNEIHLQNMTRVLVTDGIIESQLAEQIGAGDIISVMGAKKAVITAAHKMERMDGSIESKSRFWVGSVAQ